MPTISVAMATYNGALYIREQLDSIAAQTLLPIELVVTDDGSTDETLALIETFAKDSPFPVYVHRNTDRLGYKANFMKCAGLCRSDLIAFSDQDDIWSRNKLEKQAQSFESAEVLLSCPEVTIASQDGSDTEEVLRFFPSTKSYAYSELLPFAYSLGFTQVFRRSLLDFREHWGRPDPVRVLAHDEYYFF